MSKNIILSIGLIIFSTTVFADDYFLVCQKASCPIYNDDGKAIGALEHGQKARLQSYDSEQQKILISIGDSDTNAGYVNVADTKVEGDFEKKDAASQQKIAEYTKIVTEMQEAYNHLPDKKNKNYTLLTDQNKVIEVSDEYKKHKVTDLEHKTTSINECDGSAVRTTISDDGSYTDNETDLFWVKDFPKMKNGLMVGISTQQVKKILGTPTRENNSLLTYSSKVSDEYDGTRNVETLFLYFVSGKLMGIRTAQPAEDC